MFVVCENVSNRKNHVVGDVTAMSRVCGYNDRYFGSSNFAEAGKGRTPVVPRANYVIAIGTSYNSLTKIYSGNAESIVNCVRWLVNY